MREKFTSKNSKEVKSSVRNDMGLIDTNPFGLLYEYFLQQEVEIDNEVILDEDFKAKNKVTSTKRFVYFDKSDKEYIINYTWSLLSIDKDYARGSKNIPNRPLMHQYVACWDGSSDIVVHHLNSDGRNNSLLNLVTVSKQKHDEEYTPKINKVEAYAKTIVREYLKKTSMDNKKEISRRFKWVTIDIINQQVMSSLIQDIDNSNLLDRTKYRSDEAYRKVYNEQIANLYSNKLDLLLEKIAINEKIYNIDGYKLNIDALCYYENSGQSVTLGVEF